jgi:hypothetical protein
VRQPSRPRGDGTHQWGNGSCSPNVPTRATRSGRL